VNCANPIAAEAISITLPYRPSSCVCRQLAPCGGCRSVDWQRYIFETCSVLRPGPEATGTKPWFAVRFGPSSFGIIDAFPDEAAREAHLSGPVGKALGERADELFASPPEISKLDVLANKL
jgi:hypothetical protein